MEMTGRPFEAEGDVSHRWLGSSGTVRAVRTIGNVLWVALAGIWLALGYAISGALLCITVVGIPFGVQAFKLAQLSLRPFGRTVVADRRA
jgi:uncharacterized membrane protein YccF (DUF307 family)